MHGSKKFWLSFLAGLLLLALLFVATEFALTPADSYTRLLFHELYAEDDVDIAFIGSSNCYRAYDPAVIDPLCGKHTFNLGTSLQTMKGSYYMTKELFRTKSPETIVLNISPTTILGNPLASDLSDLILIKFMGPSSVSAEYFLDLSDAQRVSTVFYGRAFLPDALKPGLLLANVQTKLSAPYRSYSASVAASNEERYLGKGFVYSTYRPLADGEIGDLLHTRFSNDFAFSKDAISADLFHYFELITELCAEHGTELLLVSPPAPRASALSFTGYDAFVSFLSDYAAEHNHVSYYNFAFVKPEKLVLRNNGFYDDLHQNGEFAEEYSAAFATFLTERAAHTLCEDDWFYPSFDAFAAAGDTIEAAWLSADDTDNKTLTLTAHSACDTGVFPEYEVRVKKWGDDAFETILSYGEGDHATFCPEKGVNYAFVLSARKKDGAVAQTHTLNYKG